MVLLRLGCVFLCTILSLFIQRDAAQCYNVDVYSDKDSEIMVYGEFLYWQAVQDQMQYAAVAPKGLRSIVRAIESGPPLAISEKLSFKDPSFKYKPGFRVGLGYELPCTRWDFQLSWTRLHERQSSHVSNRRNGIIPITLPASSAFGIMSEDAGFANAASSHWRFQFDTIDLRIGRDCSCFSCFTFEPYIGVKGAIIRQRQLIVYSGFAITGMPLSVQNKKRNNFQGVGPSIGFDGAWEFYPQLSLSAGFSGALLYGKFDVHQFPAVSDSTNSIIIKLKNSRKNRIRATVDAIVGLDWDTCLWDQFRLRLGVGYEMQYWWNQWQAPSSFESSIISGGNSPQGDLMLQGLTAHVDVTF